MNIKEVTSSALATGASCAGIAYAAKTSSLINPTLSYPGYMGDRTGAEGFFGTVGAASSLAADVIEDLVIPTVGLQDMWNKVDATIRTPVLGMGAAAVFVKMTKPNSFPSPALSTGTSLAIIGAGFIIGDYLKGLVATTENILD